MRLPRWRCVNRVRFRSPTRWVIVVASVCVGLIARIVYGLLYRQKVLVDPNAYDARRYVIMMVWILCPRPIRKCLLGHYLRRCWRRSAGRAGTGGADGYSAVDDLAAGGRRAGGAVQDFLMVLFVSLTRRDGRACLAS